MNFTPAALKTARLAAGLTAAYVAAKLDVTEQTIYAWEAGRRTPDVTTLGRLAALYRCSVSSFYGETMQIITAETITDSQIEQLRTEADAAGDDKMGRICDVALGEVKWGADLVAAGQGMSRESARAECARVIAEAQAQE